MASSSSCGHNKIYMYDVFLSFRGEDTRKTFVDHLYAALDQQGICTFKDDEKLEKGRRISHDLLQSIEESRIYIIVFSKGYASSSWCLDELLKIMECHKTNEHTAFPVFYDVDPSEVRKQSGSVGEALAVHVNRNESEVGKWRGALKEATGLSGWDVRKTADGHEAKVIKQIVEKVSSKLLPINIDIDENLVGMEKRIQDLNSYLEIGVNDVRIIGIKGMGGAGKTTLARAIFDRISIDFEGKSFVENVRENSKASSLGLNKLQEQALKDLLKDTSISVSSVHQGTQFMKTRLRTKKVLIVLDDVNHVNQLEELAGDPSWFKLGSRVIITTRDESVLNTYTVKLIYDVNLLSKEEALCLFSRHAFRKISPVQEYKRQSHEVVDYAAGLPLTVKVLGSLLHGKNKSEWIDALARLKKVPLNEILKILELSYESLEDDYKEIFLNVACFLKYRSKKTAIIFLENCGFHAIIGLRVLEEKSLIKIVGTFEGGNIGMHDRLVEMGENIVRREHPNEPNKHSRLWVQEEIKHVLASDSVNEETMYMDLRITPDIVLEGFKNLKRLRCLMVNHDWYKFSHGHWKIDELPYFPYSLQYLYWYKYPYQCLPKTFEANNLVSLEMHCSKIEQLWERGKVMKQLKFLNLSYSKLKSLDLGLTPNLERLKLKGCDALVKLYLQDGKVMSKLKVLSLGSTKLRSLDLGSMPNLERLLLPFCHHLLKLYVYGGCLKSLVCLDLRGCDNVKSFSFIERLESLEVLHTDRLNLTEFPDYIIAWHSYNSLQELHLEDKNIEELPLSIGNLHKLVSVVLRSCYNLKSLPGSIFSLQHLRTLELSFSEIEELPEDIGRLECLEMLDLTGTSVKLLPQSICMLNRLKTLVLECCRALEKLPEHVGQLESLMELNLQGCDHFRDIPSSICKLKYLKELQLAGCRKLEKLPDILGDLKCLQFLSILGTSISRLPLSIYLLTGLKIDVVEWQDQISNDDFIRLCFEYDSKKLQIQGFQNLRALDLGRCDIEELPEAIGHLKCLEGLHSSFTDVKHLPDSICMLKHLEKLVLQRCVLLEKLPDDVGQLESLEELYLSRCYSIREIPSSICTLKQLKIMDLYHCFRLEKLPNDVGQLESLEELDLSFTDVKHLPDSICMLKHLEKLVLQRCVLLEKLPDDVGQLESLEELYLSRCYSIREIPSSICTLKQLKILDLYHCFCLEKLPDDVGQLESLEELDLSYTYIKHLPNSICMLKHLKKLILECCVLLEKLPNDVGQLESLEELYISRCYSIREIPSSICTLKQLKIVDLYHCFYIEKLPNDVGRLESLEELDLSYTNIKHIPDSICMLKHLKKLVLELCVLLEKLPDDVGELESLEELYLTRCYSIIEIPSSICTLKQLKILDLYHCFCLEKLPDDVGQLNLWRS